MAIKPITNKQIVSNPNRGKQTSTRNTTNRSGNSRKSITPLNPNIVEKNRAIEVDIKREIAISKADINGVTSEEIKGKVMNKKDKLKALRRRKR